MTSLKEQVDRSRRRMLAGILVGFGVWQIGIILNQLGPALTLPRGARGTLLFLSALGWITWVTYLVRMLFLMQKLKKNESLMESLNDELIQHHRLQAFAFGFWAVLVLQAMLLIIPGDMRLPAAAAANLTLLVAVESALGAFLLLDRG